MYRINKITRSHKSEIINQEHFINISHIANQKIIKYSAFIHLGSVYYYVDIHAARLTGL